MIIIKQVIENGDEFKGIAVSYDDGPGGECPGGRNATVRVECDLPSLAIELLEHALVSMKNREESSRALRIPS